MLWVYIPVYSQRPYRSTVRDTCYKQGSVGIMVNFPRCCRCSKNCLKSTVTKDQRKISKELQASHILQQVTIQTLQRQRRHRIWPKHFADLQTCRGILFKLMS